ncbi:GNAT family N-acetyltransferase [Shewanella sp.]|uniref:GNAT family N-acetyltransferase n=1 Tax=Shewanella sp. TaxID=50422 RepID=UPI0040540979
MKNITIKELTTLTADTAQQLSVFINDIPELNRPLSPEQLLERLAHQKKCLILLALVDNQLAGFKIGYSLTERHFYSWLGAVIPTQRHLGLAKTMLAEQEAWAREQQFTCISVKTFNEFQPMLLMLVKNGYQIAALDPSNQDISLNKIELHKQLVCKESDKSQNITCKHK